MGIDFKLLCSLIDASLIEFYNTHLMANTGMPFYEYMLSLDLPLEDIIADISSYRREYKKARIKTKINWYSNALRDLNAKKTGSVVVKAYNDIINDEYNGIEAAYSWDTYKKNYEEKLELWRNDNSFYLTEYPYIRYSTVNAKTRVLNKELILNVIDLLEKNLCLINLTEKSGDVIMQPLEFLFGPLVTVYSPGSFLSKQEPGSNKETVILYDDYQVPNTDDYGKLIIRSLAEVKNDINQESNLRSLSAFDIGTLVHIVNYVYENDYSTFLSTMTYHNSLSKIVKALYPNEPKPSARCYEAVKKSLGKLASLHIKVFRDGDLIKYINFFDSYEFDNENGTVKLVVGKYVYDRIATNKAQLVFTNEVQSLTDKSSQFIYYILENERQKAYVSNRINSEIEISYNFFLHTLRFPGRYSVKKNMDMLDKVFKTFIQNNILFESYRRRPKSFIVRFKAYRKEDIVKLRLSEPVLIPPVSIHG